MARRSDSENGECSQRRESCRKCKKWGRWKRCDRGGGECGGLRRPCDCNECSRDRGECGERRECGECGSGRRKSCGDCNRRDCGECGSGRRKSCGDCNRRDCGECGSGRRKDCDCKRRDCNDCGDGRRKDCDCDRRDCGECRERSGGHSNGGHNSGGHSSGGHSDCNDCGKKRSECGCNEAKGKTAGSGLLLLKWSGRVTQTEEPAKTELADGGTLVDTPASPLGQINNRYVFASKRCARSISIRTHENSIDQTVTRAQVNVLIDGLVVFGLDVPTTAGATSTRAIAVPIAAGHDLAIQVQVPPGDGDEEADTLALTVTMEFDDGANGCCLPESE